MTAAVEIPARMQHLDLDRRGLPIPFGVYRDKRGDPHFTINDHVKRALILRNDLCAICGGNLLRGRWFVGGPLSAFVEQGAYIDPPMHHECMTYALKVCPYLAAPKYARRIDDRTVIDRHKHEHIMFFDPTVLPERPPLFVGIMVTGQRVVTRGFSSYIHPRRPPLRIEFWQHGSKLDVDKGERLAREYILEKLSTMAEAEYETTD